MQKIYCRWRSRRRQQRRLLQPGKTKADRELKKRISLSVPSLYDDIQKIAYVQRRSVSELMSAGDGGVSFSIIWIS